MIQIRNSDRVLFVGMTGTGKTTLVKHFLADMNRCIIIDPKHTFRLEGFKLNKAIRFPSMWQRDFQMLIRPRRDDDERLADFLIEGFKKKNVTIYCDELAVMEERFPESISMLREIALTGREKHVSLWNATQRPRGIPTLFKTECEVFFNFRLQDDDDRKHMSGYIGSEAREKIPHHTFWYYRGELDAPRLMSLDLETNQIFEVEEIPNESEVV